MCVCSHEYMCALCVHVCTCTCVYSYVLVWCVHMCVVYVHVCSHMCIGDVFTCVYAHIGVDVCVSRGQRLPSAVFLDGAPPCVVQ